MNRIGRNALIAMGFLVIAAFLVSCAESYSDQVAKLEKYLRGNKIGSSADQWIIKKNAFGEYEKVGLVFGFMDDREFCDQVATLYMQRYRGETYICMPANP